jgi:peptide/nickel transport system ATP-binding protein/oligopeptide transport system ATP-binding protein
MQPVVLDVTGLVKSFPVMGGKVLRKQVGAVNAVNDISFQIRRGESLGLVGESGCGKSTTARLVMRLLEPTSGSITFDGREIFGLNKRELREFRREVQIVFQDPYASLNPRMTAETILSQPFRIHGVHQGARTKSRINELLELVGLSPDHLSRYPHEFSGGQRQRLGIARALSLDPSLLVLDEPVSSLDVSIQAQILNLLQELKRELGLSYLIIAHDLAVVRHVADRIAVMYLGNIVETATRDELFSRPLHPYSQALLSAVPIPDPKAERQRKRILLLGDPPSASSPPPGCRFNPRCHKAAQVCSEITPTLDMTQPDTPTHLVACHFAAPLSTMEVVQSHAGDNAP